MVPEASADLEVSAALTIPAAELQWRFSRSSGPGGQHVNTSDSRVQLTWSAAESAVLSEEQRSRILERLSQRMVAGAVTVTVSQQRSQLRNRELALERLAECRDPRKFGAWLVRIVRNRAFNHRRYLGIRAAEPLDNVDSAAAATPLDDTERETLQLLDGPLRELGYAV